MDALKSDGGSSWGNQMRSYVQHPTKWSRICAPKRGRQSAAVLDGDIDGFLEAGIGGVTGEMTTISSWRFPSPNVGMTSGMATSGNGILSRGLHIAMLLIGALLAGTIHQLVGEKITRRIDADFRESDALVRSESAKHRQAVASVISYVAIALLAVMVIVEITDILAVPVSSLVAPAAVLGAALGFGAQRIVQDLLSGFLHHHREAVRVR